MQHKYEMKTLRNMKKIVVYNVTHGGKYFKEIVEMFLPEGDNQQISMINALCKGKCMFYSSERLVCSSNI